MTFDMTQARPENFEGFFKARKRPMVIDALKVNLPEGFHVDTLEGRMEGKPGDYLLIGTHGEPYPCAAEIFESSYDAVPQEE